MFGDETWQGSIELSMLPDARQLRFASQTYHVPNGTRFSLFVLPEASSSLIVSGDDCQGRARLASSQSQPCRQERVHGGLFMFCWQIMGLRCLGSYHASWGLLELIVLAGCASWCHVAFATIARARSAIHIPTLPLTERLRWARQWQWRDSRLEARPWRYRCLMVS
jgi:hypothetical protein